MNFKVIFHLDGSGIYYSPADPIHLDAVLAWIFVRLQVAPCDIGRDDNPEAVKLPVLQTTVNGNKIYRASALFPEGETASSLRFLRKKFRSSRVELAGGSPNLQNGTYREYNLPVTLLLTPRMVAYASGNRKEIKKALRKNIFALGKKRAYGYGRVIHIECEEIPDDYSLIKDGRAMRWLPDPRGTRWVRPQPPYWNNTGKVRCLEVGSIV